MLKTDLYSAIKSEDSEAYCHVNINTSDGFISLSMYRVASKIGTIFCTF